MMSYRFRTLGLVMLGALAVSAVAKVIPSSGVTAVFASPQPVPLVAARHIEKSPRRALGDNVQADADSKAKPGGQFTIYQNSEGEIECREATAAERGQMPKPNAEDLGLRPINHLETVDKTGQIQPTAAPNLTIILRATQQLQQSPAASAAFTKAAQNWEAIIKSPVTIYIDVDYGATRFGQTWPSGVLGATNAPSQSYPYQSVRTNLIAEANGEGNATKQAIFNALPGTTVPTDLGDAIATDVTDPSARAIGLLPATAQSTDDAAMIAFNSGNAFDFDPSDGITAGK